MKLFISYRRQDSERTVSVLSARLEEAFGPDSVFVDQSAIGLGADFLGAVGGAIYTSDLILVVIGPNWASMRDSRGKLRLEDKEDPVAMEVGLALAATRNVIPLLVDGATMPSKRELPRALHHLATLNAFRLQQGAALESSIDELIERLGGRSSRHEQSQGFRAPRRIGSTASFEGRWQTQDGGMTSITQDGDSVELRGQAANGVAYQGRGKINGRQCFMDFANSIGLRGRLSLELVENGFYINGQLQSPTGVMPFVMMRRT
jgi:hypothetical protein